MPGVHLYSRQIHLNKVLMHDNQCHAQQSVLITLIEVDAEIPEAVLKAVAGLPHVKQAKTLQF